MRTMVQHSHRGAALFMLRESDHKGTLQYLFAEDVCDPVL